MNQPDAPIDLVVFDCDGVLIDSEPISFAVLRDALQRLGARLSVQDVQRRFQGRSLSAVVSELEAMGVAFGVEAQERMARELQLRFESELQAIEGMRALIKRLAVPACVASSSHRHRLRHSLETAGLADLFGPRVFSADQVARGKPAPDLFLLAARAMGADPSRSLVVEDSVPGLIAARAAGMEAIAFTGGAHLADPFLRRSVERHAAIACRDAGALRTIWEKRGLLQ